MLRKIAVLCVRMRESFLLSALSGVLLSVPFWNGKCWLLAWVALVPLFIALENKPGAERFLLAFVCGLVFWWSAIFWLVNVTFFGTAVLIAYLSIYFGLFGFFLPAVCNGQHGRHDFLFVPALWVLLEYARSYWLTGFPWALLGYSQFLNLPAVQIADLAGAWGVSFCIVMVNVAVYAGGSARQRIPGVKKGCALVLACMVLVACYGYYCLRLLPEVGPGRPARICVVQGNIPQDLKWTPEYIDFILKRYLTLTRQAAQSKPDLIIWPEAANPDVLEYANDFGAQSPIFSQIIALGRDIKIPILLGSVVSEKDRFYNSALLLDAGGKVVRRYDKIHLVPFGEYIPFRNALPFLQTIVPIGDISAGREYTVFGHEFPAFALAQARFSVLICFEDFFPELSRQFVRQGAGLLVNITNDAWYKKGPASLQHLQASVFRAVENRSSVVRAANTGISGFIDPKGKIVSLVKDASGRITFIQGVLTQEVPHSVHLRSFYTRRGDVFVGCCCVLFVALFLIRRYARAPQATARS